MARIAFILLCHKDPEAVVQQAEQLTAVGDYVAIHFDKRASDEAFSKIQKSLSENKNVAFVKKRVKCGWGEWSLVDATLRTVETALNAFPRATHFYMLSGDCMAIKSAGYAHQFLDNDDVDYIESFDYFESDWIKTGLKEERLIYRHWFNERTQKKRFYWSFWTQRRLGITRSPPEDIQMMIGSQWWCLRRRTMEWVVDFAKKRKDVIRFFKTTWIPDETFFQTVVRHVVPSVEIRNQTLTFLAFTDYGMPLTFYNDHYDLLLGQDALFARKISAEAQELKSRLGALYASGRADFPISNEGRNLFRFLTGRGRIGRRFQRRFWETEASLGRERELLIIACKKWHVAKRLTAAIREQTAIPALDYVFDEEEAMMPDLGGIQSSIEKRTRHRRSLMRMLFDHHDSNRLIICLDTSHLELLQDFFGDKSYTKMLEIECAFDDENLLGHAMRIGLASSETPAGTLNQLIPTIRNDIAYESDRIRDENFAGYHLISENDAVEKNAETLARFLAVDHDTAHSLANTPYLFDG